MRIFCNAKDFHIIPAKNYSVFAIFAYCNICILNFNEMLTNDVVNFKQLAPGWWLSGYCLRSQVAIDISYGYTIEYLHLMFL